MPIMKIHCINAYYNLFFLFSACVLHTFYLLFIDIMMSYNAG